MYKLKTGGTLWCGGSTSFVDKAPPHPKKMTITKIRCDHMHELELDMTKSMMNVRCLINVTKSKSMTPRRCLCTLITQFYTNMSSGIHPSLNW